MVHHSHSPIYLWSAEGPHNNICLCFFHVLQILFLKNMSNWQATWEHLQTQSSGKRTRVDAMSARKNRKRSSSAPHEIIVQRHASEPDNKQTFKPRQPREFVNFEYGSYLIMSGLSIRFGSFGLSAILIF